MRSALRLGLGLVWAPPAVPSLSGFEQATAGREQAAASLQMDGWKCRAMSDRMWTENLVVATAPRYCGTVSRCFDLVWYASPFCLGPKFVAERLLRLVSATQKWTA